MIEAQEEKRLSLQEEILKLEKVLEKNLQEGAVLENLQDLQEAAVQEVVLVGLQEAVAQEALADLQEVAAQEVVLVLHQEVLALVQALLAPLQKVVAKAAAADQEEKEEIDCVVASFHSADCSASFHSADCMIVSLR